MPLSNLCWYLCMCTESSLLSGYKFLSGVADINISMIFKFHFMKTFAVLQFRPLNSSFPFRYVWF